MCVYRLRCGPCHSPGDEVRVAHKMAGPLRRFGRGERAKRRCLPEMSRGLLIPVRAAPFCVLQLEVWVPLNHFRHVERHIVEQKTLVSNSFRRPESESMPVAEGGQTPFLARLATPGTGKSSVDIVGRRIDGQSSPLRLPNTETAGESRSTESAQRLGSHFPPLPSCSAYLRLYRHPMY